jgi:hypothetical protein
LCAELLQLDFAAPTLLDFDTNRSLALFLSLSLSKDPHDVQLTDLTLPLPILILGLRNGVSLDDVPLLFSLLQQSNDPAVWAHILKAFSRNPDVRKWTDFCKRIVIIGCVPPAERRGDDRVVPTHMVLLSAIKISVLLVRTIRDTFPTQLSCVDDVVAIAFNAMQMKDKRIDYNCFSILSSVITLFSDIRNEEGALLDVYSSQFHPILVHAVSDDRDLQSVAGFVIAYYRYLLSGNSLLLGDARATLVSALTAKKFNDESLSVFLRIASLLDDRQLSELFAVAASQFVRDVCGQTRSLLDLREELPDFVRRVVFVHGFPLRILLGLLVIELDRKCDSLVLAAINGIAREVSLEPALVSRVLYAIHQSELLKIEGSPIENDRKLCEETDLDSTAFWVVPPQRTSTINVFLSLIASKTPPANWVFVLSLAAYPPVSYASLAQLVRIAPQENLARYSGSILAAVLRDGWNESSLALLTVLFALLKPEIVDALVYHLIGWEWVSISDKFAVLKVGISRLSPYRFTALEKVCAFVLANLLPEGLTFISSMLVDEKSALCALSLVCCGVASAISPALTNKDIIRHFPRILHFLKLSLDRLRVLNVKQLIEFQTEATRIALFCLGQISSIPQKAAVVVPACLLLRSIDRQILESALANFPDAPSVFEAIRPARQRKAPEIQLRAFAQVSARSERSRGGWQNLDQSDD